MDIASQCLKFGAKGIVASYRTNPMAFKDWPSNYVNVPLLERVEGQTVYFKDGTSRDDIDVIMFATGFKHHLPFMAESLKFMPEKNSYYPEDLYKVVLFEKGGNDKLFYLAM